MKIQSVFDEAFVPYGRVIEGYDTAPIVAALGTVAERPKDTNVYYPSIKELEALPEAAAIARHVFGGMPTQCGYCSGTNHALNCLEYHRNSEVIILADDIVLLLALSTKIKKGKLDTSEAEAFHAPAGTIVQFYETSMHYAPCDAPGQKGFSIAVILPKGTNTEKPDLELVTDEDKMLLACNKWLLAHPDSPDAKKGAYIGLTGENIIIA